MASRSFRILIIAALFGAAASARLGLPLPETVRFAAAALAFSVLPGWWIASSILPDGGGRKRIPLAWAVTQGITALLAVLFHLVGLPLAALLIPLGALAWAAAFRGGEGCSGRESAVALAVTSAALLVVVAARPASGPTSDAYDHWGAVRFMVERGDPFPRESFHADRIGHLDPRKGTNHTVWALASLLSDADPAAVYPAFWALQVWMILLVLLMLAEAVLPRRGEALAGTVCFVLLYRGGPGNEWFWTAGYPGKSGLLLFFIALALALRSGEADRTERRRLRAAALLLGAGSAGVHAFTGILSLMGGTLVAAAHLVPRRLRGSAGGPLRFLAALLAGAAPIFLFRFLFTYDPANPLHLHRQGTLMLSDRLAVLEPTELLRTATYAGAVSLLLLPFFFGRGRPAAPGETVLVLSALLVVLLVMNPLLYPWLEERGGYLTRRIPLLAPYPLILGAAALRGWRERRSPAHALGGIAAVMVVLLTFQSGFAAHRVRASAREEERVPAGTALLEAAARIPAGSTVLSDPLTAYTLYGRTPLHIAAVPDQHSSPNDPAAAERIAGSQRILHGLAGPAETDAFLERFGVDYVLINGGFESSFHTYNVFVSPEAFRRGADRMDRRPERFLPLDAPADLHLFRVRRGGGPEGGEPPRRDEAPALRRIDEPLPGGFRLVAAGLDEKSAPAGGIITLNTLWILEEKDPGGRPPILFVRARREGDPEHEPWGFRRDPVLRPWSISPLGTRKDPALLWKDGDRAREVRPIRVPPSASPGSYRLEITVQPDPFFPVRRLEGLRRGAQRSDWVVVDTVEVRS